MRQLILAVLNVHTLLGLLAGWLLGARRAQVAERDAQAHVDEQFAAQLERAAEIAAQLDPLVAEISALNTSAATLRESVAALDKQLGRVGREQFKVNTLGEAQQQQIENALEQLGELNTHREADVALLREQLHADQSAQRLLVIQRLLPALDGLDQALAAGERLRARAPNPEPQKISALSFQQRLAIALGRGEIPMTRVDGAAEWRDALTAWLAGLELVRERLLHALAAERVYPLSARGEPFDPNLHIAVETAPATDEHSDGMVIDEYRRGYQVDDRVLRAAEVVVARAINFNGEENEG